MNTGSNNTVNQNRTTNQEGGGNILSVYGGKAFEYLVNSLCDQDKWVRIAAADALAGLADTRCFQYIVTLLGDKDPDVRFAASVSLGKLGDARAIRPLESACHDPNYFVRQGAGESLKKLYQVKENTGWRPDNNNQVSSLNV